MRIFFLVKFKFRKFKIEYNKSIKKSTGISVCHGIIVSLEC